MRIIALWARDCHLLQQLRWNSGHEAEFVAAGQLYDIGVKLRAVCGVPSSTRMDQ